MAVADDQLTPTTDLDNDDEAVQVLRMLLEESDVAAAMASWEEKLGNRSADLLQSSINMPDVIHHVHSSILKVPATALNEAIELVRGGVASRDLRHELARLATVFGCQEPEEAAAKLQDTLRRAGVESLDLLEDVPGAMAAAAQELLTARAFVSAERVLYVADIIHGSPLIVRGSARAAVGAGGEAAAAAHIAE